MSNEPFNGSVIYMRRFWLLLPAMILILSACDTKQPAGDVKDQKKSTLDSISQLDSVSYSIGLNLGNRARTDSVKLNPEMITRGISDGLADKGALSDSQMNVVMMSFQATLQKKQEEKLKRDGETNEAAGKKFLAENKSKSGVVELPSGLQYKIVTPGTGKMPTATDQVQVLYKGRLLDGTVFDSSLDRSNPVSFSVNGVIPGWTEALQKMGEGAKWEIYIPGNLAYGLQPPPGGKIGANALLIFEVELLTVLPPAPADEGSGGGK